MRKAHQNVEQDGVENRTSGHDEYLLTRVVVFLFFPPFLVLVKFTTHTTMTEPQSALLLRRQLAGNLKGSWSERGGTLRDEAKS